MFERTSLPGGPRVISARLPGTRSLAVAVHVLVGSRQEAREKAGLAHFMEHITFRGTAGYPTSREVAEAIEGVGGTSNAATDHQVRLELRPAVRLDGSVGDGSSQLATFTTRVAIQATLIERASYWVDTQGALLKGIAAALGAAVVAVLLWWDKLPLRRRRSPASSATTSSGPDGDAGPWVPPPP